MDFESWIKVFIKHYPFMVFKGGCVYQAATRLYEQGYSPKSAAHVLDFGRDG